MHALNRAKEKEMYFSLFYPSPYCVRTALLLKIENKEEKTRHRKRESDGNIE
jgi:hypothetical protein